MVSLNTLYLGWNNISDTSALKNLKNLEDLYL
jgi:Leucine-rich repeat (LRR) protein